MQLPGKNPGGGAAEGGRSRGPRMKVPPRSPTAPAPRPQASSGPGYPTGVKPRLRSEVPRAVQPGRRGQARRHRPPSSNNLSAHLNTATEGTKNAGRLLRPCPKPTSYLQDNRPPSSAKFTKKCTLAQNQQSFKHHGAHRPRPGGVPGGPSTARAHALFFKHIQLFFSVYNQTCKQ